MKSRWRHGSESAPRLMAIRGAITVAEDTPESIREAVTELLGAIARQNSLEPEHVVSAMFTATQDLTSIFPAEAARDAGWIGVPMLCGVEMPVSGSLGKCIRVLVHSQVPSSHPPARHLYLRDAASLRPDLSG
jgi:chorismate mutase